MSDTSKDQLQKNPYFQLADVLHELFWAAAKARSEGKCISVESVAEVNRITDPWDKAEQLARSDSLGRGIPFAAFDAALSEAEEWLHKLVQVAGGNESVPFNSLDLNYVRIEKRLKELGTTFAGTGAVSDPAKGEQAEAQGQRQQNRRRGAKPLENRNPLQFQVYQRIQQAHGEGEKYLDTKKQLESDRQFLEQVKDAGLKLNCNLVKKALAFFDQRKRRPANNQQIPPA